MVALGKAPFFRSRSAKTLYLPSVLTVETRLLNFASYFCPLQEAFAAAGFAAAAAGGGLAIAVADGGILEDPLFADILADPFERDRDTLARGAAVAAMLKLTPLLKFMPLSPERASSGAACCAGVVLVVNARAVGLPRVKTASALPTTIFRTELGRLMMDPAGSFAVERWFTGQPPMGAAFGEALVEIVLTELALLMMEPDGFFIAEWPKGQTPADGVATAVAAD
jgi:hypothetical protein